VTRPSKLTSAALVIGSVLLVGALAVMGLARAAGASYLSTTVAPMLVPTRYLPASGGTIKWPVMVYNATMCRWSSSPELAGFDGTVKCKPGRVVRPATFQANTSTGAKGYTLNLVMRGTIRTVVHLEVVEAGVMPPPPPPPPPVTPSPPAVPASPAQTSANWSGYVIEGANDGAGGNWTVPILDCAAVTMSASSDWVGVNGATSPELFQTGVTDSCIDGSQSDYAWFTDAALGLETSSPGLGLTISPGDAISAEVFQDTSGFWAYSITDLTSGETYPAPGQGEVTSYSGQGVEAEWVEEDPSCTSGENFCWTNDGSALWPFADFRSVTFTDLTLYGVSSWTLPWSDAWAMTYPDRSVEALPSSVQGSGASAGFTVTYAQDES